MFWNTSGIRKKVVREIFRIAVKPGGIIYISVPFIFPFHADPDDFYHFSYQGIDLCEDFECIDSGFNRGPALTMHHLLVHFMAMLFCFNSKTLTGSTSMHSNGSSSGSNTGTNSWRASSCICNTRRLILHWAKAGEERLCWACAKPYFVIMPLGTIKGLRNLQVVSCPRTSDTRLLSSKSGVKF